MNTNAMMGTLLMETDAILSAKKRQMQYAKELMVRRAIAFSLHIQYNT